MNGFSTPRKRDINLHKAAYPQAEFLCRTVSILKIPPAAGASIITNVMIPYSKNVAVVSYTANKPQNTFAIFGQYVVVLYIEGNIPPSNTSLSYIGNMDHIPIVCGL